MGDVMNIANLVSDLDLFRPFRQLLGMRDLKKIPLTNRFFAGKGFSSLLNQHQALGKAM